MPASPDEIVNSVSAPAPAWSWRNLRALAGFSSSDLIPLARRLRELANEFPSISQQIDGVYIRSSSTLDPLTKASEELTVQSAELLRLAIGQADGDLVVNGTTDLLAGPFAYLDSWREGVQGYMAELSSCEAILARLEKSQLTLNALVSPLKHIQTMFRIEAARLPEEVRQSFSALTNEIAAVHHAVNETFAGQFRIVAETSKTLQAIRQRISTHADTVQAGLVYRRQRVAETVETLRQELARNGQRETELHLTSDAIGSSTATVVMSLQTHDICTQRMQHVAAAMAQALSLLESRPKRAREDNQAIQETWCLLMVQAAQVEGIHKLFQDSERSLRSAVEEISSKVIAFEDECLLLKEFKEVTVATNGLVELSLEMIQELDELLRGVIDSSRTFCESLQPLHRMTAGLTDALESLSNKMRLIALNAQVQAVHIGSGTGLEVLAAQTATVSDETSRSAEAVSADTQLLLGAIFGLTASLQAITTRGEAALEQFGTEGSAHRVVLHGLRDRTLQHLQLVGQALDEIGSCTKGLHEDSELRQSTVAPLQELASELRLIAAELRRNMSRQALQATVQFQTQYKMQSERQVHRKVLTDLGLADETPTSDPEALSAGELDTSIEMF